MRNWKIVFWSVTVALGGFLFGFDTAVISGAEQAIQKLWGLSDALHGFAIAMALYGTVIGAAVGGWPADRFGRKKTLFWIGLLYLVSAVGSAVAPDIVTFMIFRFIGGLGVGASSVVAPMYISEIAPAERRGRLVILFQFNIVLGILIAYVSNYLIGQTALGGEASWRWMLGVETLPALLFSVLVLFVPRSPRWLIVKRGDEAGAREVLSLINPANVEMSVRAIRESIVTTDTGRRVPLFSRQFRFPIVLAFLFAFFNQLSGINAIIYFAPRIFEMTGMQADSALLSTSGIGMVNLLFTFVGMYLIDRAGRRTLMFIGSLGLILSLGLTGISFLMESFTRVPYYLFGFIAFFALSQGAVIWVFISEIFPNQVRAAGQSLGSFTHWIFAALITNVFPWFANNIGGGPIFLFFTVMMFLQLIYVLRIMPETKGVSLEELEKRLLGKEGH